MIKKSHLSRPAATAIAAFLAFSTSGLTAQTVIDGASPPPVNDAEPIIKMTSPVATPPTTTTPSSPTITTQEVAPPVIMAPEAKAAAEPAATQTAEAKPVPAKPAARAAKAAPPGERAGNALAATTTEAPAAGASPMIGDAMAETMIAPPVVASEPVVTTTQAAAVADDTAMTWALVGGGAALLVLGGAGVAMTRRRRAVHRIGATTETRISPPTKAQPVTATHIADMPAYLRSDDSARVAPAATPAPRTTPSFAAAPMGSMGRHEAAAMAGPTPDNPFRTLEKRLKRARFYDRKERLAHEAATAETARKPVSAWEISQRPEPAPAIEQEVRRPAKQSVFPGQLRPGYAGR